MIERNDKAAPVLAFGLKGVPMSENAALMTDSGPQSIVGGSIVHIQAMLRVGNQETRG